MKCNMTVKTLNMIFTLTYSSQKTHKFGDWEWAKKFFEISLKKRHVSPTQLLELRMTDRENEIEELNNHMSFFLLEKII